MLFLLAGLIRPLVRSFPNRKYKNQLIARIREGTTLEYDRYSNLPIESADIGADISADRYLLNFAISAYLQICHISADRYFICR